MTIQFGDDRRDSQQAALDAKRFADNYVDVVSADTIGRFPAVITSRLDVNKAIWRAIPAPQLPVSRRVDIAYRGPE